MKTKVAAIISFTSGIIMGLVVLNSIYKDGFGKGIELLLEFNFMILITSTLLYIVWTKFGKMTMTELEKIEYENQLLRKKVEQKELKKRLDE